MTLTEFKTQVKSSLTFLPLQQMSLLISMSFLAGKPLKCFCLHNQSVDKILWSGNLGFKALLATSELCQCYPRNTRTSLCNAFSKRMLAFTTGSHRGNLKEDVEVSVASCVKASMCMSTLSKALCQKYACGRNKGKESRLYWSGCNILPSLRRKDSYIFGQSRVFLSYFLELEIEQTK